MIRVLRPTDLIALAHFHRGAAVNLARGRDPLALGHAEPGTAGLLLADWRLPARRRTWVAVAGRSLIGLVSCRRGPYDQIWEIDRLLLPPTEDSSAIAWRLLEEASLGSALTGIERVYLRLPADHAVVESAARAGFVWYTEESVFCRRDHDQAGTAGLAPPPGLRRRDSADDHTIFRLYSRSVPPRVRQAEALTFHEWQARQGPPDSRRSEQWVLDRGDSLALWLRLARRRQAGRIEGLYLPENEADLNACVGFAIGRLAGPRPLWALVPAFQPALVHQLQAESFEEVTRSAVFVKHLAARVRVPVVAPAYA